MTFNQNTDKDTQTETKKDQFPEFIYEMDFQRNPKIVLSLGVLWLRMLSLFVTEVDGCLQQSKKYTVFLSNQLTYTSLLGTELFVGQN